MADTKITSKYQMTLPKEVRVALNINVGDVISFEVLEDGSVILKKAAPFDQQFMQALSSTLSEWNSTYDEEDFDDLQDL